MNRASVRILVLDDEPFMHKVLNRMLSNLGFTSITTCESGIEALKCVDIVTNPPHLILLDLHMPDMDGIQFVRKLVEHGFTGSLVLVSGEDERMLQMSERLIEAHRITVLGHLAKPVAPEKLAMVLDKWQPAAREFPALCKAYSANELRSAIDNKELVNFYQPKVNVATRAVVGAEALVRWRHPIDGLVPPDQIIGIAEEHGLIDDLTRLVLTNALAQARVWENAGLTLRVAVNISMNNLSSVAFADFVAEAAFTARLSPENIVLELTESRLMLDQRAPLEILSRLRLKRFLLSIDDFGTGHSSLTQLLNIRFDELKIDRSFVHGACRDGTARAMFDASLSLGKQLGMTVVAEGIEDSEDWQMVRQTECDFAQGYFIGRPMPADEFSDWIEAWKGRLDF